ncbi:MAG: hypothetical protein HY865_00985 [Chloroflexi bacterium]|nr:hypothetical protein [Chloroflexota bacterium]
MIELEKLLQAIESEVEAGNLPRGYLADVERVRNEQQAAQHRMHLTGGGLCAVCGKSADHHEDHDYVTPLTATSG